MPDPSVTWATVDDVTRALGVPVTDPAWLAQVTDAANQWAFRRRADAGYVDDPTAAAADVTLGVVLLAKAFHNERGTVDGFASFEQLGPVVAPGTLGQVNRLLGLGKPAVW